MPVQDSDGDGIGDLKGIESRLDHFVDLGVKTIWLSPIYKVFKLKRCFFLRKNIKKLQSPMEDFGYDVSDYRDVDPIFGTLDDFRFPQK